MADFLGIISVLLEDASCRLLIYKHLRPNTDNRIETVLQLMNGMMSEQQ